MTEAFLTVFNLSIVASWFVLAILILRKIFSKAPKSIFCILWLLVGLRLAIPFSLESVFSLVPSAETISPEIIYQAKPNVETGFQSFNDIINPVISESLAATPQYSANPVQIILAIASNVWISGAVLIILYGIISYAILKIKVRESVPVENNIRECSKIASPFILGFIRPQIYIPFGMDKGNLEYVLAHERAHLKRRDHLIKPIGFALLAIYWFNPVIWIAYIFLCRDIEFACDEKVVRNFEADQRAKYATALLDCSINRRSIAACPLAFGEVGVKERIRKALSYKKPVLWLIIAAVISAVVLAICFMTNPKDEKTPMDTTHEVNTDTTTDAPAPTIEFDIKEIGYIPQLSDFMSQTEDGNGIIKISNAGDLEGFLAKLNFNPFKDITDPIEKVYFEDNFLLAVYYPAGSGSFIYKIEDVTIIKESKSISVSSVCTVPEVFTDDMSGWLGLIEIRNVYGTDIADYDCIQNLTTRQYKAPQLLKSRIVKTANWKTEGLKSAGLDGMEVLYTGDISYGALYLLEEKEPFSVYKYYFLAVETEKNILLTPLGTGIGIEYVNCSNLDGEKGDEIVVMVDHGGNGGAGTHGTYIFKPHDEEIKRLFYADYLNTDYGFSAKLLPEYKAQVENRYTQYNSVIDIGNEHPQLFDANGNPAYNYEAAFDCINKIEPTDIDNDGIYELICHQYSYIGTHSNYFGDAVSTLKYHQESQAFIVVDADFVPYKEEEGKVSTEFYELIAFTQKPTDSHFKYTYTIFAKDGDILMGASSNRKPTIEMISDNVLRVYTQTGTGRSTCTHIYFDVINKLISQEYNYVLDEANGLVAYAEHSEKSSSLIVKSIFDDSFKKDFVLDEVATITAEPILSAEFSNEGKLVTVTYYTGNDYETRIEVLELHNKASAKNLSPS